MKTEDHSQPAVVDEKDYWGRPTLRVDPQVDPQLSQAVDHGTPGRQSRVESQKPLLSLAQMDASSPG